MRKLAFSLCLLLSLSLCLSSLASAAYMPDENKDFKTNSQAVYLYNTDTGTVIYQKNEQMKLQPASTAKIMTAVLALENTDDLDEEFTYPSYIFNMLEPGVSQADVRVGETMTMRKALYALMLQSDCFSALAIADRIGDGDIDAFIQMMNDKAKELGIKPMAKWVAGATAGVDPSIMGIGPAFSTKKLFDKTGLTIDQMDLIEANEAFAAQSVAVGKDLGFDLSKLNPKGGAIALGHPVGASGCRILVTLLHEMQEKDAKTGLATLCIGGGMGCAAIVKRD